MSYCVNCGVELEKSEKKCPLCGVAAVNPAELPDDCARAFPERRDILEHAFDRQLWVQVVSVLLAVPAVICLVANILVSNAVTWSLYVIGGMAVSWVFCVSPFLFKKYFPLLWIVAGTLATLGYLYLIEILSPGEGWFIPLALPIVLGVAVLSLALLLLIQKGILKELYAAAGVFAAVGILTTLIELSISLNATGAVHLAWSWYSLVSCLAMAVVLAIIERRLLVKEKLKRKLHL